MNAKIRELLRQTILQSVEPSGRAGLTQDGILLRCRQEGISPDSDTLAIELDYLADKQLLGSHSSALSAGLKRHTLTAKGREYLEEKGLI